MSLNWGLIGSGGTFESLVHTILRLEFPSTLLFGRPGPDSGQDAISGDRRTVYQAKFRTPCTMKAVKAAALEEAKSIETYRDPKHSNSDLWKSVSDWVLVANYRKNPNDQREWDADVVPAFAALKIVPHLWGIEELEALIAKHPEVTRHYFQGETRTFLGLLEAREFLASYQVNAKGMEVPLAGRDREVTDVTQRIEGRAKKLFHIYGPGGVGKTRLAYEIASSIGQKGWQILWAATRSMERSTNWFAALPASSQKTLVVVDEPEDPATLEALIEQVSVPGGAAGNWKVLVTTRTPKDPVVEVIKRSRSAQVDDSIQVQAPSRNDGMEIARALLRDAVPASELERVCGHVCRLADNYPIWINLAARLISERGSIAELPDTSAALADQYLAEVIYQWIRPSHPLPDVEEIVRWLALFGAINIEDKEQVSFIASHIQSKSASAVAQIVEKLEERSLVQSRGARRRWREIKPDVLKDHVVYKLLLNAQGANAAEVTKLSTTMLGGWKGGPVPQLEDLLRVLSRIELMKKASGTPIDLLGAFYKAVKSEISSGTTAVQLSLALLLEKATLGRTTDIIECVDLFLKNKKPPETTKVEIWGERTVSHVDVVKHLAWLLFGCAHYATSDESVALVACMVRVLDVEMSLDDEIYKKIHNDGKRAAALLDRMIIGGPSFWATFSDAALKEANRLIKELAQTSPMQPNRRKMLDAIVKPLLKVERTDDQTEGRTIHIRRYTLSPKSREAKIRREIMQDLKRIVEAPATHTQNRVMSISLLSFAFGDANSSTLSASFGQKPDLWIDEVKESLDWAMSCLVGKIQLSVQEKIALRDVWDWSLKYDKREDLTKLAAACEDLFKADPTISKFYELMYPDSYYIEDDVAKRYASELSKLSTRDLCDFVEALAGVMDKDRFGISTSKIAELIGFSHYSEAMAKAAEIGLKSESLLVFHFFSRVAVGRVGALRRTNVASLPGQLDVFVRSCPSARRQHFLIYQYGHPHPLSTGDIRAEDADWLLKNLDSCVEDDVATKALILGSIFDVNWGAVTSFVEHVWPELTDNQKADVARQVIHQIQLKLLFTKKTENPLVLEKEKAQWVLDLVLTLDSVDELGSQYVYNLKQLLKPLEESLPISWLLGKIDEGLSPKGKAVLKETRHDFRVVEYIRPAKGRPEDRDPLKALVGVVADGGAWGYVLPPILHEVDAEGEHLAGILTDAVTSAPLATEEEWSKFKRTLRIAVAFGINSPLWRGVAKAACVKVQGATEKQRNSTFSCLESQGVRSYFGSPEGIVSQAKSRRDAASELAASESDPDLRPFFQWYAEAAESEFQHYEQQALEEEDDW